MVQLHLHFHFSVVQAWVCGSTLAEATSLMTLGPRTTLYTVRNPDPQSPGPALSMGDFSLIGAKDFENVAIKLDILPCAQSRAE
jgi:hypothetical protein